MCGLVNLNYLYAYCTSGLGHITRTGENMNISNTKLSVKKYTCNSVGSFNEICNFQFLTNKQFNILLA